MAFDYKREYKEFYLPPKTPGIITVPAINFLAVRGHGDPNEEGLCVQCMHIGPYDDEPATVTAMEEYAKDQGYEADFREGQFHHEIYLSDVRRCKPEN